MANVFKETSAPFVLALALGIVGWLFNSALDTAKTLRVLDVSYEFGTDQGVPTITYWISNLSLAQAVNAGEFVFKCPAADNSSAGPDAAARPDDSPKPNASAGSDVAVSGGEATGCLRRLPSAGAAAQYLVGGNIGLPVSPGVAPSRDGIHAAARVPPRGNVGFTMGLDQAETRLQFVYLLDQADISGDRSRLQTLVLGKGTDRKIGYLDRVTVFVISNYLSLVTLALAAFSLCVLIYLLVQFLAVIWPKRRAAAPSKARFIVKLRGETHVLEVEEI
ncbi:hypothetical protein [Rhizobium halophytocola]|uniref:Uncharacterized protein n=1 Tax=Rhizobium halophytocola TaxID=735519 RepID=A0ABS4DX23_9HYPH|nr:hypothetical protein [Rhizobium halophytocola]MBP1850204.1 hypothetical protein [Rhizobium halophytocola]